MKRQGLMIEFILLMLPLMTSYRHSIIHMNAEQNKYDAIITHLYPKGK